MGENKNPFYYIEEIPPPIISPKAMITKPGAERIFMYDIATQHGHVYTIISK